MTTLDSAVLDWMVGHRTGWATWLARLTMWVGTNMVVLAVFGIAALTYVVLAKRWTLAITVIASVVFASVSCAGLKLAIGRSRPPADLALAHAGGFSMPSSDGAVTAAGGLALVLGAGWAGRLLAGVVLAAVVNVGLCMVYLAAHWTTDVLAGWVLGGLIAWLCHSAVSRLMSLRRPIPAV